MFASHQAQISRAGRKDPQSFARVCKFALATIRVHLRDAAESIREDDMRPLVWFGSKFDGRAFIERHARALWQDAEQAEDDAALMRVFMRIPGIGFAKAGFLCQLLYGRVGCLDTHNLVRFGIPSRRFRSDLSARRVNKLTHEYVRLCDSLGGCAQLWDGWCEYVGHREGDSAEHISALHLCCIAPEPQEWRLAA